MSHQRHVVITNNYGDGSILIYSDKVISVLSVTKPRAFVTASTSINCSVTCTRLLLSIDDLSLVVMPCAFLAATEVGTGITRDRLVGISFKGLISLG